MKGQSRIRYLPHSQLVVDYVKGFDINFKNFLVCRNQHRKNIPEYKSPPFDRSFVTQVHPFYRSKSSQLRTTGPDRAIDNGQSPSCRGIAGTKVSTILKVFNNFVDSKIIERVMVVDDDTAQNLFSKCENVPKYAKRIITPDQYKYYPATEGKHMSSIKEYSFTLQRIIYFCLKGSITEWIQLHC